jgi:hypothetical protein
VVFGSFGDDELQGIVRHGSSNVRHATEMCHEVALERDRAVAARGGRAKVLAEFVQRDSAADEQSTVAQIHNGRFQGGLGQLDDGGGWRWMNPWGATK